MSFIVVQQYTNSPPETLKAYPLPPWDPVGLPLDPLGTLINSRTYLAQFGLVTCYSYSSLPLSFFILPYPTFQLPQWRGS